MYLEEIIGNIRLELGDTATIPVWSDDELIRAINKSVSIMSRLIPRKNILEVTLQRTITGESLVISSGTGTLASLPLGEAALSIPGKTLNTHYRVNWLTGVVTTISTGLPDNTYTVSYTLDPTILDISPYLTDFIRIDRVEYDEANPVFQLYDKYLVFTSSGVSLTHNNPLRITYLGKWTPPDYDAAGNYPSHMNDIVIIGASGQALIYKAEYYVQMAGEAVALSRSILDDLITITFPDAPDVATELAAVTTALDAANAAFDTAIATLGSMTTPLGNAATALGKIDGRITTAAGFLTTGAALINKVNVGEKVGEIYGAYGSAGGSLAQKHGEEGTIFISLASGWEEKAARESIIANGYAQEASQRISAVQKLLDRHANEVSLNRNKVDMYRAQLEATTKETNLTSQYLAVGGRYLASGQSKINEFLAALGYKPELAKTASSAEQRA